MREPLGPREPAGTTPRQEPYTTPAAFAPRHTEQAIYTTLHEIQHEQGRQAERFDRASEDLKALGEKIDKLVTDSALMNAALTRVEPKIGRLDTVYKIGIGVTVGVGLVIGSVGTVLYYTNSARLDRLIKVLDSPGVEKLLKKDGK